MNRLNNISYEREVILEGMAAARLVALPLHLFAQGVSLTVEGLSRINGTCALVFKTLGSTVVKVNTFVKDHIIPDSIQRAIREAPIRLRRDFDIPEETTQAFIGDLQVLAGAAVGASLSRVGQTAERIRSLYFQRPIRCPLQVRDLTHSGTQILLGEYRIFSESHKKILHLNIDYLQGEGGSLLSVIEKIRDVARINRVDQLYLKAIFANEQLERVLKGRYGLRETQGQWIYEFPIEKLLQPVPWNGLNGGMGGVAYTLDGNDLSSFDGSACLFGEATAAELPPLSREVPAYFQLNSEEQAENILSSHTPQPFVGLSEGNIKEQLQKGLRGGDVELHPDVKQVIDRFHAFADLESRMRGYQYFSEGLNLLAANRFVDPELRKWADCASHILRATSHVDQLMTLSQLGTSAMSALAVTPHLFSIGTAVFTVMTTLLGDDEEELPQNGLQELSQMMMAGFHHLSNQLQEMHRDISDIRAVVVILPELIRNVEQRLSLQIGSMSARIEEIAQHTAIQLNEMYQLLTDMRREDDGRLVSEVQMELADIKDEITHAQVRYGTDRERMQDLIMRVAPRLEQWILVHSTNRFYTGLHRNESDDYSNYLWASRMGCGWQIGRIAQDCGHTASYCPNPEILLFLVPLYIQVRRMAIAHQVTYDLNGEI